MKTKCQTKDKLVGEKKALLSKFKEVCKVNKEN